MTNELLWTALNELDDVLIEAADRPMRNRRRFRTLLAATIAACLLIGSVCASELGWLRIRKETSIFDPSHTSGFSVAADVKRFSITEFGTDTQALMSMLSEESPSLSRYYRTCESVEAVLDLPLPENDVLTGAQFYCPYRYDTGIIPFVGGGGIAGDSYPFALILSTNQDGKPIIADVYAHYLLKNVWITTDIRYFTEYADFLDEEDSDANGHYWSNGEVILTTEEYTLSDGTAVTIVESVWKKEAEHPLSDTAAYHAYFLRDGVLHSVQTREWAEGGDPKAVLLAVLDGYA